MRVSRGMLRSRCWDGAERAAAELGGGGEAALGGTPALCCGAQRLSGCGQEPLAAADKIPQEGPARPPAPALSLQPGVRPCAREAARSRVLALGLSRPSSPCRQHPACAPRWAPLGPWSGRSHPAGDWEPESLHKPLQRIGLILAGTEGELHRVGADKPPALCSFAAGKAALGFCSPGASGAVVSILTPRHEAGPVQTHDSHFQPPWWLLAPWLKRDPQL
ncbi:uncharacterized protein LOC142419499 isoform X1 [Mycteria americana]|uniref:uncharacterized protein LOC142419499 isoform X1 n=1 Tax=Mycteria americana TaxID=33587 RepID=UPI003F589629